MSVKLAQLTEHLISLAFIPRENLESWVDICTVIPESINHGHYQEICRLHHKCTLMIERYTGDSRLITAWMTAWLNDNDPDRDRDRMPDPDIDVEALDASGTTWDIDITLEFVEPVLVVEDQNGVIPWNGLNWSVIDEPIIDTARHVEWVTPSAEKAFISGKVIL